MGCTQRKAGLGHMLHVVPTLDWPYMLDPWPVCIRPTDWPCMPDLVNAAGPAWVPHAVHVLDWLHMLCLAYALDWPHMLCMLHTVHRPGACTHAAKSMQPVHGLCYMQCLHQPSSVGWIQHRVGLWAQSISQTNPSSLIQPMGPNEFYTSGVEGTVPMLHPEDTDQFLFRCCLVCHAK